MVELIKDPSPHIRRRELLLFIDDCRLKIKQLDFNIDEMTNLKAAFEAHITQAENELKNVSDPGC